MVAANLTIQKKNVLLDGFSSCSVFSLDCESQVRRPGSFYLKLQIIIAVAEQKCNELVAIQGLEVVAFVLRMCFSLLI